MLSIGDKVAYPMHGAGVIESIEEKEILGKTQKYYVLKLPIDDVKIMIPLTSVKAVGIRRIINIEETQKVFAVLGERCIEDNNANWNRRYRSNLDKIKSGDIYAVAEVVKSLMLREKDKGLSAGERKMLNSAKQILISELVLAKGINAEEIEKMIEERVWRSV